MNLDKFNTMASHGPSGGLVQQVMSAQARTSAQQLEAAGGDQLQMPNWIVEALGVGPLLKARAAGIGGPGDVMSRESRLMAEQGLSQSLPETARGQQPLGMARGQQSLPDPARQLRLELEKMEPPI